MKCACGKSEAGMGLHGEVSCWGNGHDTTHHTAPGCLECAAEREAGLRAERDHFRKLWEDYAETADGMLQWDQRITEHARRSLEAQVDRDAWRARAEKAEGLLSLSTLRTANETRQREWDRDERITLVYRANELAGEVGEACNVAKKLERERLGIRGSRDTVEHLAEELADVVICCDLLAMHEGIDLGAAVVAKFNATSEKNGLATRLAALPPAPEEPWLTCGDSACGWTGHQSELDNGAHCPWCGLMVDRAPAPEEARDG